MSCPVRIRGVDYPSQTAAARALGVHPSTVNKALDDGLLDEVGLKLDRKKPENKYFIRVKGLGYIKFDEFLELHPEVSRGGFLRALGISLRAGERTLNYRRKTYLFKLLGEP